MCFKKNNMERPDEVEDYCHNCLKELHDKNSLPYELTVSIGWALCDNPNMNIKQLLAYADEHMYKKKEKYHQGR